MKTRPHFTHIEAATPEQVQAREAAANEEWRNLRNALDAPSGTLWNLKPHLHIEPPEPPIIRTPFPKPPTREQEPEPIASIPVPIWKMQSSVHLEPAPNPPTTNRPIGITVVQVPRGIPLMLPPMREQEREPTVIIPRDLLQVLNQLPIAPTLRDLLQNSKLITPIPITNPPREPIVNPPIPITPLPIIRPSENGSEREPIASLPINLPVPNPPVIFTPRDLLQPLTYFLAQEQELRPPTSLLQDLVQAQLTY